MKTILFFKQLFFCIIIFQLSGQLSAQSCQASVESFSSPWGDDIVINSSEFITSTHDSVFVSLDINGPYTSDLMLNCGNVTNATGPVPVYVQIFENGIVNTCVSSLSFLDTRPPVLVTKQNTILVLDENGHATVTAAEIDNGSYDVCTPITISISQTNFDTSHIGYNTITFTALDTNGVWNSTPVTVVVLGEGGASCRPLLETELLPWGEDKIINSSEFLLVPYDSAFVSFESSGPFTTELVLNCADVTNASGQVPVYLQIFVDGIFESCMSYLSLFDRTAPVVVVKQDVTIFLDQNGQGGLSIAEFDNGSYDNCTPITLSLSQSEFNTSHIGVNRVWLTAIDSFGNFNMSWGNVFVVGNGSLICDYFDRNTPITDCTLGHTDQDDVEWPSDLSISDYRISPQELIDFSSVDPLDAQPIFFNTPSKYSVDYVDIEGYQDSTILVVERVWSVEHSDYNYVWKYTQYITIELAGFVNLVSIENFEGRPMSGVIINGTEVTNTGGKIEVEGEIESISYNDESLNGVNVLDVVEIQHHILGVRIITDPNKLVSCDLNNDGSIRTTDLVETLKVLLNQNESTWKFEKEILTSVFGKEPKGVFKGYKFGDVNGDVVLEGESDPIYNKIGFSIKDKLLNKGERYSIPIYIDEDLSVFGLELRMQLEDLTIEDVTSNSSTYQFHVDTNGDLNIVDFSPFLELDKGIPMYTLEVMATENKLISNAIAKSKNRSYLVDEDYGLLELDFNVTEVITTGLEEQISEHIRIYPNPASSVLFIETQAEKFDVSLYNSSGVKVKSMQNEFQMDISSLPSGVYTFVILDMENVFKQKIIIID